MNSALWAWVLVLAVSLGACRPPAPPAPEVEDAESEVAESPALARENEPIAARARRQAQRAFWNQPASVHEFGLGAAERACADAALLQLLVDQRAGLLAQREAADRWVAALAAGSSGPEASGETLATASAHLARRGQTFKGEVLACLTPAAVQRLAQRYPRFLRAPWVRTNRLVDQTDLSKWTEDPKARLVPR